MKKICLTVLSIIIIATAVLLAGCGAKTEVAISGGDGLPSIVYNKFDRHEMYTNLYVYQIGGETQKIASHTGPMIRIGNDNSLLGYSCGTGSVTEGDVYIVDRDGRQQLLDMGISYYKIASSAGKIFYNLDNQPDTVFVKDYIDGQLADPDSLPECEAWVINADGSTIVVTKKRSVDDEDVNDMYLLENGTWHLIAEDTTYPDSQHISGTGDVLFVTEYDKYISAGRLYLKRAGGEPELIAEKASAAAQISEDGTMIIFVTTEGEGEKLHCMYDGNEIELPDDSVQRLFSRTSNTLVYSSTVDGQQKLFKVKEGGEPQEIADADVIMNISADGSCVAYLSDLNRDKTAGSLYAARDGQEPELVDTLVSYSSFIAFLGTDMMLQMNDDGSVIAYCKKYYASSPTADLYVKQKGEEPVMVDERVALGFRLF